MRSRTLLLSFCLLLWLGSSARAEEPSDGKLIAAGMGFAVPTYMIGVAVHEGSHALAAKMVGAKVTDYSLLPGFHPRNDKFYFGYVSVRGLRTDAKKRFFYLVPKLSDAILLSSYSLAYGLDAMPSNKYGHLALTVLATGFWIDFSKDFFAFWDHNDTVKAYTLMGLESEWERLPLRILHVGLSAAMGVVLYKSYSDIFELGSSGSEQSLRLADPGFVMPLFESAF